MTRIRLLFVLTSTVRAGVEEMVLGLLTRLPRRDFELALACPDPLIRSMAGDLESVETRTFQVGADSWFKPREIQALVSCVRQFRPHIVNPHLFRSTLVAAPLAKWLRVPRVVETYHGREAWRQGMVTGSFVVDRVVAHWVDRVIAVSEAARDFLLSVKGIRPGKVTVVPNGRDLSVFSPGQTGDLARKELDLGREVPVIGVVGRLEPQKGHRFLLDALPMVLAEFPDARLLLVGDGSLRGELEEQARRLGVLPHVVFAGFRTDVARLLDAMDVVVLPSLHEGMPLTAIETAAMAKPIVATAVDGIPEVVRDGVTGRLVGPAAPSALGEAILDLLRNPARARRMGEAARRRVLERFDIDPHIDATAEVYREVLGRCS